MKYKLIICDMDGTLLSSKHNISEYTKNIISKISEKGIIFIIATGRPYLDAKFYKNQLGLKSYLVTSNGATIHNEKDEEIISETIPANLVENILKFEVDKKIYHRNIYVDNDWYIEYKIDGLDEFHAESGFSYKILDFKNFKIRNVTKIFYLAEEININLLEKKILKNFQDNLTMTLSSPYCLELMKKGINKAYAVKKIADSLNISLHETIAFGDGLNDYEMLSIVGKSFIMGNASSRLKEKLPNREIIGTCDEDAVAKKLEELFL